MIYEFGGKKCRCNDWSADTYASYSVLWMLSFYGPNNIQTLFENNIEYAVFKLLEI